ncbi:cyanidin-3-O-glucoside 2-O-glucuronosyltransferase-like [Hibiscus syriacus]|uniref:Cyanidin-3-O-glucoside 2-O-glucuronosyltransferase-like n=1 Tax=Hibiscus syriacus TaxID=106335 RepID=A0A6A2YZZ3_HIBSY|nr:cyanidin-3-O-glucoside 2-O-glucuronosyltransferase-like [Hibiscus syriacus]
MSSFVFHALKNTDVEGFPFPEIYLNNYFKSTGTFVKLLENSAGECKEKVRILQCFQQSSNIILVKTFRELEGKYMDYLSILVNKRIILTGPLFQGTVEEHHENEKELIEWLTMKRKGSTVFVSFGSEYFLSKKEREAIAEGLDLSEVNFFWVIRFPVGYEEKPKLEKALSEGYLEKISGRGVVVEGWAPQARILQHPSIGGFVSHCGRSSIMESLKFGVPIIAMPMQIDQPLNARVVDDLGVGVEVKRNKDGNLEREEIGKVIKQVVGGKECENIRRKAKYMSKHIEMMGDEEVDEIVEEFNQILYKASRITKSKQQNINVDS